MRTSDYSRAMANRFPPHSHAKVQRSGSERISTRIAVARSLLTPAKCKRAFDSAQTGCEPVVKQRKLSQADASASPKRTGRTVFDSKQAGDAGKENLLSGSELQTLRKHVLNCKGFHESIRNQIKTSLALAQSGTVSHVRLNDIGPFQALLRSLLKSSVVLVRAAYQYKDSYFRRSSSRTVSSSTNRHTAAAEDVCVGADSALKNPNTKLLENVIQCFLKNETYLLQLNDALIKKDPQEVLKIASDFKKSVGKCLDVLVSPTICNLRMADLATKQVSPPSSAIQGDGEWASWGQEGRLPATHDCREYEGYYC